MLKPPSGVHLPKVLTVCLVVSACGPAALREAEGDARPYVVAGNADGAPASCGSTEIAAQLVGWFRELGEGDGRSAAAFFGIDRPDVPFAWFSFTDTTSATHFAVRTSADSLAHRFDAMAARDIDLRGIDLVGWVPKRESIAFLLFFEYFAAGGAHDAAPERRYGFGKAEFHCPSATFLVMSIGRSPEEVWRKLYALHLQRA